MTRREWRQDGSIHSFLPDEALGCKGVERMPVISMFYGLIVRMYFYDNQRHHEPHIHVEYAGQRAVYRIPDGCSRESSQKTSSDFFRRGSKYTEMSYLPIGSSP